MLVFPQMCVVTQNKLLWTADRRGATAVSISRCYWWPILLGAVWPMSCPLSCSMVVLRCLPWDRHLGGWAPGHQLLAAGGETPDKQELINLGKTPWAIEGRGWMAGGAGSWAMLVCCTGGWCGCRRRV